MYCNSPSKNVPVFTIIIHSRCTRYTVVLGREKKKDVLAVAIKTLSITAVGILARFHHGLVEKFYVDIPCSSKAVRTTRAVRRSKLYGVTVPSLVLKRWFSDLNFSGFYETQLVRTDRNSMVKSHYFLSSCPYHATEFSENKSVFLISRVITSIYVNIMDGASNPSVEPIVFESRTF